MDNTTFDIAGPEPIRMDDLVRQYLAAVSRPSCVPALGSRPLTNHSPRPQFPPRPDPFRRMVPPRGIVGWVGRPQLPIDSVITCMVHPQK
jgi:hypothetical protein